MEVSIPPPPTPSSRRRADSQVIVGDSFTESARPLSMASSLSHPRQHRTSSSSNPFRRPGTNNHNPFADFEEKPLAVAVPVSPATELEPPSEPIVDSPSANRSQSLLAQDNNNGILTSSSRTLLAPRSVPKFPSAVQPGPDYHPQVLEDYMRNPSTHGSSGLLELERAKDAHRRRMQPRLPRLPARQPRRLGSSLAFKIFFIVLQFGAISTATAIGVILQTANSGGSVGVGTGKAFWLVISIAMFAMGSVCSGIIFLRYSGQYEPTMRRLGMDEVHDLDAMFAENHEMQDLEAGNPCSATTEQQKISDDGRVIDVNGKPVSFRDPDWELLYVEPGTKTPKIWKGEQIQDQNDQCIQVKDFAQMEGDTTLNGAESITPEVPIKSPMRSEFATRATGSQQDRSDIGPPTGGPIPQSSWDHSDASTTMLNTFASESPSASKVPSSGPDVVAAAHIAIDEALAPSPIASRISDPRPDVVAAAHIAIDEALAPSLDTAPSSAGISVDVQVCRDQEEPTEPSVTPRRNSAQLAVTPTRPPFSSPSGSPLMTPLVLPETPSAVIVRPGLSRRTTINSPQIRHSRSQTLDTVDSSSSSESEVKTWSPLQNLERGMRSRDAWRVANRASLMAAEEEEEMASTGDADGDHDTESLRKTAWRNTELVRRRVERNLRVRKMQESKRKMTMGMDGDVFGVAEGGNEHLNMF